MRARVLAMGCLWIGCGGDGGGSFGGGEGEGEFGGDGGAAIECYASNDCPPGDYCDELGRCVPFGEGEAEAEAESEGEPPLPPETEIEATPPATGDRYVYVALAGLDEIAKIDSESLEVTTIEVGDRPEILRTAPGRDLAVALSTGNDTVSIVRDDGEGGDTVVALDVFEGANNLEMSPGGDHAIAFFKIQPGIDDLPATLQDLTVVALAEGDEAAYEVSVGFNVREIEFTSDGEQAFAITDDGVSIIDLFALDGAAIAETIEVTDDPADDPEAREIEITPDGEWAFVRREDVASLGAVDLGSGEISEVALSGVPTDLDLAADASRAVAVLRDASQVAIIGIPTGGLSAFDVETVDLAGELVGSAELTPDGETALLYTNATDSERVVVLDLDDGSWEARDLEKSILTVAAAPGSGAALVIHGKEAGDPTLATGVDEFIDRSFGYTLVRLDSWFRELHLADAQPGRFVFTPDGERAFVAFSDLDAGVRSVADVDLDGFVVTDHELGSPPVDVGLVASTNKAFVAQDHPSGRITFIDMDTGETRTVTGFQLNSEVVE